MLLILLLSQILSLNSQLPANSRESIGDYSKFYEVFPKLGNEAKLATTLSYENDEKFLYVTVTAYDQKELFASSMGRDENLDQDDYIELIFDNYNQQSTALVFQTNPIGTKKDMEIKSGAFQKNIAWNGFWEVETKVNEGNWTARFIIPISTLRFNGENDVNMNFKVNRYIKSINSKYTMPYSNDNISDIEYNLKVYRTMKLKSVKPKMPVIFKPYITSNYHNKYELNDDENAYDHEEDFQERKNFLDNSSLDRLVSNIGMDLKYKFSPQSHMDISINTDFAQAESDEAVVNLSRFSLFRPEKREFFLENSDLFNFNMFFRKNLFYSRRIGIEDGDAVPIIAGARFIASSDKQEYGLLSMLSHKKNEKPSILYSTARFKQKLKDDDSFIGFMYTGKESDSTSLASIGVDGKYNFTSDIFTQFFITANKEKDGRTPYALGLRFTRFPSEGQIFNLLYKQQKDGFSPELGFIGRKNMKKIGMFNGYIFRDLSDFITDFRIGNWSGADWDIETGQRLYFESNLWARFVFNDGSSIMSWPFRIEEEYIDEEWDFSDDVSIPVADYRNYLHWIRYNSPNYSNKSYFINVKYGDFYGAEHININPGIQYIFSKHMNINLNIDFNRFNFPKSYGKAQLDKIVLNSKLNYAFTNKVSIKLLNQYNHEDKNLLSNLRFRYNPEEGTDLFLVFNQHYNLDEYHSKLKRPRFQNNSIILKFTKSFIY